MEQFKVLKCQITPCSEERDIIIRECFKFNGFKSALHESISVTCFTEMLHLILRKCGALEISKHGHLDTNITSCKFSLNGTFNITITIWKWQMQIGNKELS